MDSNSRGTVIVGLVVVALVAVIIGLVAALCATAARDPLPKVILIGGGAFASAATVGIMGLTLLLG
ncbi:hypothetical protein [Nocardia lijiangensis]|uniref:hypothetical protein n=1 Tax=Nocardia lijiangensis TaxID=299618 RepID=UPI000B163CAF|nr:hypothetical protein [Nocardia lijiangensis]